MTYETNYLAHYGTKGQKWGVRRFQNEDGTLTAAGKERYGSAVYGDGDSKDWKRLNKDAAHDANEWAKAKAYYGEGAGTRRKKLRNALSEKMKDKDYKAEFDKQLSMIDMAKTQKHANTERKINDAKNKAAQVGRGVKNFLLGAGTSSLAAIALVKVAQATGADKKIADWAKQSWNRVSEYIQDMRDPARKAYRDSRAPFRAR